MALYYTLLTNLGAAKIAAAFAAGVPLEITHMAVGDGNGNPVTPSATQTNLVRETYRTNVNSLMVNPRNALQMIAEMVVPYTAGGYTVREVGVFDSVGALIAVAKMPDFYMPTLDQGATRDLVIRVVFEVATPTAVTITVDPNLVIATREWVIDNFSLAVLMPGGTTGMVLRKKSNTSGDVEWYDPTSGLNVLVDTVVEEQTLALNQTIVNLAVATTSSSSIYVEGLRLHPGDYTVNLTTRFTLTRSYPAGTKILVCQNDPSSPLNFLKKASYFAEIAADGAAAQATARTNLGIPATFAGYGTDQSYIAEDFGANPIQKSGQRYVYPAGSVFNSNSLISITPGSAFQTGINHPGQVSVNLGTALGEMSMWSVPPADDSTAFPGTEAAPGTGNYGPIVLSPGAGTGPTFELNWVFGIQPASGLSTATNSYEVWVGAMLGQDASGMPDGCYLRYTHSVNGGRWQAVVKDSTQGTTYADTGVVFAVGWQHVRIVDNGANATFYINGVQVAQISTNRPAYGTGLRGLHNRIAHIRRNNAAMGQGLSVDFGSLLITGITR